MKYRILSVLALAGMLFSSCVKGNIAPEGGESGEELEPQLRDYIDEYGINRGKGVKIGETVWAPVNCGYHATDYKYGKLYQWGRKYGQGYDGDATTPELIEGPVSLAEGQSESNAGKFYSNSISPCDWLADQDDHLWNAGTEESPLKTEYDPCPKGWRVPTDSEFIELRNYRLSWTIDANNQAGYWFSGSESYSATVPRVFFPAAGYLDNDAGDSINRGDLGCYCSSRTHGINTCGLAFRNDYLGSYVSSRACGFSVRCVQE